MLILPRGGSFLDYEDKGQTFLKLDFSCRNVCDFVCTNILVMLFNHFHIDGFSQTY